MDFMQSQCSAHVGYERASEGPSPLIMRREALPSTTDPLDDPQFEQFIARLNQAGTRQPNMRPGHSIGDPKSAVSAVERCQDRKQCEGVRAFKRKRLYGRPWDAY